MAVVVTGLGMVSALGRNTVETWRRLVGGNSAIALRQPFPEISPHPLAMLGKHPADLNELLLRAATAAMQDAGLPRNLPQCGIVIGSSRGHQARWEQFLAHQQIDDWMGSLPHMGAIAVARLIGTVAPVIAPMAACATGLWAIAQGSNLIQTGQCERVLVGAGEAAITPLTLTGFDQMRAMARSGCYPFDEQREGLVLGEGAAVLVLEAKRTAENRSARIYGEVLGAGLTADANHISAPDTTSLQGGASAIATCLKCSHLTPEDISLIHAHGTSTALNDAYEAALIREIFPPEVWITATKGATGHTLGASGALGAVVCLLALHHQLLPPCIGLQTPAFNLNLVRRAQSAELLNALCFSFGFGGQNAVIAFGHRP